MAYTVTYTFDPYTRVTSSELNFELAAIASWSATLPSNFDSDNASFVAAGGTANAITVSHPITSWASYTGKDGYKLCIQITTENTDAVTLGVDGLTGKACVRNDGSALQAGDLQANGFYDFIYDETAGNFKVKEAINGVLTDATAQADAASTSASNAATSESNAATSESNASTSASNASSSASTASSAATTATNYATKTDGFASGSDNSSKSWAVGGTGDGQPSAGDAKSWATKAEDSLVDGSEYSAKHYAAKAAASAATAGDDIAGQINGATAKNPPVDADEFGIADSAASYGLKKVLWSVVKSTLWTALGALINGGTSKGTPGDDDKFALSDNAASNATKYLSFANLKTTLASTFLSLTGGILTGAARQTPTSFTTSIDVTANNVFERTGVTGSFSLSFTGSPSSSQVWAFSVIVVVSSGTPTITWPVAVDWETNQGAPGTLSEGTWKFDFFTRDGGTNYRGSWGQW